MMNQMIAKQKSKKKKHIVTRTDISKMKSGKSYTRYEWTNLSKLPKKTHCTNIIKINDNILIIGTCKYGLWKYNIITNQWTYFKKSSGLLRHDNYTLCYDDKSNILYLCGSKIISLYMDNQSGHHKKSVYKPSSLRSLQTNRCILIDNYLHIFGGKKPFHLIWDVVTHKIINEHPKTPSTKSETTTFPEISGDQKICGGFAMVHLSKKNQLLLMGGADNSPFCYDQIWSLSIDKKQVTSMETWQKCATMPCKMRTFAHVLTSDERYIITFGGCQSPYLINPIFEIFVLDLMTKIWKKCRIKSPVKGKVSIYKAIIMKDNSNIDFVINGYLRDCFGAEWLIPDDISHLIAKWCNTEYVYLLDSYQGFWRINVNDILYDAGLMVHNQ